MADRNRALQLRCRTTTALYTLDGDLALLDAEERHAAERLKVAEDRRDYVAAHALLRRSLSAFVPEISPAAWRFARALRGKPVVLPQRADLPVPTFSLSHSRGLVGCVVGDGRAVGIDIEGDTPFAIDALVAAVCSQDERAQLAERAPPDRTAAFLDLWTLKEACAKLRGLGIADDLPGLSFDLRHPGALSARLAGPGIRRCHLALYRPHARCRIALAVEDQDETPPIIDAALIGTDGGVTPLAPSRIGACQP